jgi:hypothetical protein
MNEEIHHHRSSRRSAKALRRPALAVLMVLVMLAAPLVPMVGADSRAPAVAPDLIIEPAKVVPTPTPYIVGVTTTFYFDVGNVGNQNAFGFNVTLTDDGSQVDMKPIARLNVNVTISLSLNWTPLTSGDHEVQISAWYGPLSAKLDMDWTNNNVTLDVNVLSRPDVEVAAEDIVISRGAEIEPDYIQEKDLLTLDVTVHNRGTSRVDNCNISLWEGQVGEGGNLLDVRTGVIILPNDIVLISIPWDTSGLVGKRTIIISATDVDPEETILTNNEASRVVKIHSEFDIVLVGQDDQTIDTPGFKINVFVIIEDQAKLTITSDGNATIDQEFPDQLDIVIRDSGALIVDGGELSADRNCTIFLYDQARFELRDGTDTRFKVIATGSSRVILEGSTLNTPHLSITGGSLKVHHSTLDADVFEHQGAALDIFNSTIQLGEQLSISGKYTAIRDSLLHVRRVYPSYGDAVSDYPQLEDSDSETRLVEALPPALIATNGAVIDLFNVSVESTVYTHTDEVEYWTNNRLAAKGLTSFIFIWRYLDVFVKDWADRVVPGANVTVLDYFKDMMRASDLTDDDGYLRLEVKTDHITEAQKPFVGNLRMKATLGEMESRYVRFSHNKYPKMDFEYNVLEITIKMAPLPPEDPVPDPKQVYVKPNEPEYIGGTASVDKNIVIDDTVMTIDGCQFTLVQDHSFQWSIFVKGTNGELKLMNNASLSSPHKFAIYLNDGAKLTMATSSSMSNTRVIAKDQSSVIIRDSVVDGDLYTKCDRIEFNRSNIHVTDTYLEANSITIEGDLMPDGTMTSGYITTEETLAINGRNVELIDCEMTSAYSMASVNPFGGSDLRRFTDYYGWSYLDDESIYGNASWFDYFPRDVNLSIEATSTLLMNGAFMYGGNTTVVVTGTGSTNTLKILNSWVGGNALTLTSHWFKAWDSSFNRVLDDFQGTDEGYLYSVELPGIECAEQAIVERYWYLSVLALDGAGSVRPGALLWVEYSETNARIYPIQDMETHESSRTNEQGTITVSVKANSTDSSGDYFIGSIRFWLIYDQGEFEEVPTTTGVEQISLMADRDIIMVFPETIESPKKDIEYVIYNITSAPPNQDIKLYHSTFNTNDAVKAFLNDTLHLEADRVRQWDMIRGTTVQMALRSTAQINNEWVPLQGGAVRIYFVNASNFGSPNLDSAHINSDGKILRWVVWPDARGEGAVDLTVPDTKGDYMLYIQISGGTFDPEWQEMTERLWTFEVIDPPTIEIFNARVVPTRVRAGDEIVVSGIVRKIFTQVGINGSEITVVGEYIREERFKSRPDGTFSITIQAPIVPSENYTLSLTAIDPVTDEVAAPVDLYYAVFSPPKVGDDKGFNWMALYIVLLAVGIGLFIVGGAIMVVRRQWGNLVECGECGAFIPANSLTCPKCSVDFETDLARCSECEAWIPADSAACPVCNTPFSIEAFERQVADEEAQIEEKPIEEVTTSTAQISPLTLGATAPSRKPVEGEERRRRRIKKRVKKRLTVAEAGEEGEAIEPSEATDLFVGETEPEIPTRLPGIDVDEATLSEDELSRLLPTEDMLKELMLTSEGGPEADESLDEELDEEEEEGAAEELLEEIPPEEVEPEEAEEPGELEEIPPPEVEEFPDEEAPPSEAEEEVEPEEISPPEGALLEELGLTPPTEEELIPPEPEEEEELEGEEEEGVLDGLLTEEPAREAPKLCPNCGGNWILYKGGEYTCRICGERW